MLGKLIYEVTVKTPDINASGFVFWMWANDFKKNLEYEFENESVDVTFHDDGESIVFRLPIDRETDTDAIDTRIQEVIADFIEDEQRQHPRAKSDG